MSLSLNKPVLDAVQNFAGIDNENERSTTKAKRLGKWAEAKSAGRSGACTRTSKSSAPPAVGTPACSGEKTIAGCVITGSLGWSGL
ncbi:hypothetical protein [Limnohabitans sp.]|uniref:hypothetical protein n=1 Tax=Limnohabitans sp. TaxID=1907725 RepID=UPI0037BE309F